MDLEQSIHNAKSIEVTVTQGETTRWTSFIVEADGNRLEFTAFGDLPIRYTYLENETVENLAGELAALRSVIQVRDPAPADPDHRDVLKMSEFRLNRARAAEKACEELRAANGRLTNDLDDVVVKLNEFKSANDKLADNVEEWSERCKMLEDQLADIQAELRTANAEIERGDA